MLLTDGDRPRASRRPAFQRAEPSIQDGTRSVWAHSEEAGAKGRLPSVEHHRHRGRRAHAADRHHRSARAGARRVFGMAGLRGRCTAARLVRQRRREKNLGGFLRGSLRLTCFSLWFCVWGWRSRRSVGSRGMLADRCHDHGERSLVNVRVLRAGWFHGRDPRGSLSTREMKASRCSADSTSIRSSN